jgi:hypothetical protein
MSSAAMAFQQEVGAQLARALGEDYKFFRSRLELRRPCGDGFNVLVLSGSNKYSPFISLEFYFGRNFAEAKRIEKLLGPTTFHYHIQQYSLNRNRMSGLVYEGPYTWSIDITRPMGSLLSELVSAVEGMANPFFERFATIRAARDAVASDDDWCFGGPIFWRQLILLDAAMEDLGHFKEWAVQLDDFNRSQAEQEIEKLMQLGIR